MFTSLFILSQIFLISNTVNYYILDYIGTKICDVEQIKGIEESAKKHINETELFFIGLMRIFSFTSMCLIFILLSVGLFVRF
jgi:hypothetical protein